MTNTTFLPEDYLAQKAERRTNLICLSLFVVVMVGVAGAFLVSNRQWKHVKIEHKTVNARYQEAAMQIDEIKELESQKTQMLEKAELAAALVERVPRSILLAELINRMPDRLSLLEFDMKAEKVRQAPRTSQTAQKTGRLKNAQRAKTKEEAGELAKKVEAPRYEYEIMLVGVAPTDLEVSRYMTELNAFSLVRNVTLDYSEEKEFEERPLREFKISLKLAASSDVREIDPLVKPRKIHNPMTDQLKFLVPSQSKSASTHPKRSKGD